MTKMFIFCIFISFWMTTSAIPDQGHSFNAITSKGNESCAYCHRVTYSSEIKSIWATKKKLDTIYPFISSGKANDKEIMRISNQLKTSRMSELCISCHTDYTKHAANFHPVSFNASEMLQSKLDGQGKVNGTLPLYDGFLECSSCHNPHSKITKYLRTSKDEICKSCHDK